MTQSEIEADLAIYITARDKILTLGTAYTDKTGSITRADLPAIEKKIDGLRLALKSFSKSSIRYPIFRNRT